MDYDGQPKLNYTVIDSDVYAICIQHALSEERVEIIGLLLGEYDREINRSLIKHLLILDRVDKRPDRVEISPETLSTGAVHADQISTELGVSWHVIGWYHSHPHITVWPSLIGKFQDLRTQFNCQLMDSLFVGLIFSVYETVPNSFKNSYRICCFQSCMEHGGYSRVPVELKINPSSMKLHNLEAMRRLPKILYEEEKKSVTEDAKEDPNQMKDNLSSLYNEALDTTEMVHIMSLVTKPIILDLEERLEITRTRIAYLEKLKKNLLEEYEQSHCEEIDF